MSECSGLVAVDKKKKRKKRRGSVLIFGVEQQQVDCFGIS